MGRYGGYGAAGRGPQPCSPQLCPCSLFLRLHPLFQSPQGGTGRVSRCSQAAPAMLHVGLSSPAPPQRLSIPAHSSPWQHPRFSVCHLWHSLLLLPLRSPAAGRRLLHHRCCPANLRGLQDHHLRQGPQRNGNWGPEREGSARPPASSLIAAGVSVFGKVARTS